MNHTFNSIKLYRNARTAFMVKPIWTWIMHDLSEYCNANFPNEKFGLMIDNASSHDLLEKLPYDNIQFINLPPNCTVGIQRSKLGWFTGFKILTFHVPL